MQFVGGLKKGLSCLSLSLSPSLYLPPSCKLWVGGLYGWVYSYTHTHTHNHMHTHTHHYHHHRVQERVSAQMLQGVGVFTHTHTHTHTHTPTHNTHTHLHTTHTHTPTHTPLHTHRVSGGVSAQQLQSVGVFAGPAQSQQVRIQPLRCPC